MQRQGYASHDEQDSDLSHHMKPAPAASLAGAGPDAHAAAAHPSAAPAQVQQAQRPHHVLKQEEFAMPPLQANTGQPAHVRFGQGGAQEHSHAAMALSDYPPGVLAYHAAGAQHEARPPSHAHVGSYPHPGAPPRATMAANGAQQMSAKAEAVPRIPGQPNGVAHFTHGNNHAGHPAAGMQGRVQQQAAQPMQLNAQQATDGRIQGTALAEQPG